MLYVQCVVSFSLGSPVVLCIFEWVLEALRGKLIFSLDYSLTAELLGVDFDVEFLINA